LDDDDSDLFFSSRPFFFFFFCPRCASLVVVLDGVLLLLRHKAVAPLFEHRLDTGAPPPTDPAHTLVKIARPSTTTMSLLSVRRRLRCDSHTPLITTRTTP